MVDASDFQFEQESLEKFARHVPRILHKQLISDAINQWFETGIASDADVNGNFEATGGEFAKGVSAWKLKGSRSCRPSIERFHATLLFVDISGFTILSQKLNVDQLRSFINAYFKKLIDIVHKYDGEVVKFAGDALFIIWQTKVDSLESPDFTSAARKGVLNAVACGMEINANCSDYKVDLVGDTGYHNHIIENLAGGETNTATDVNNSTQEKVAYLNVHSGLSAGLMAGVDVGHKDRWEYLLIGQPLIDVAIAEGEAGKGELVISKVAHKFLHTSNNKMGSIAEEEGEEVEIKDDEEPRSMKCPSCSCCGTDSGYFKVTEMPSVFAKKEGMSDEEDEDCLTLYEDILDLIGITEKYIPNFLEESGESIYSLQRSLLNNLVRHAHEATRTNMQSENVPVVIKARLSTIVDENSWLNGDNENSSQAQSIANSATTIASDESGRKSFVSKIRENTYNRRKSIEDRDTGGFSSKSGRSKLDEERILLSELREVIVLFINVSLKSGELVTFDNSFGKTHATCPIKEFSFLERSELELAQDMAMLQNIQDCMRVLVEGLQQHGGHLRQFIVDDKGTVCIGTFGLRGSTSNDLAADAIQAAKTVVDELKQIDIEASIGVTSGRVYCGLVGSPTRHEYAVMGPSVNLSARLMGKAKFGDILCDSEIKRRDRTHLFHPFAQIQAKGYAKPVSTFKPTFQSGSILFEKSLSTLQLLHRRSASRLDQSDGAARGAQKRRRANRASTFFADRMQGRDDDVKSLLEYFQPLCVEHKELLNQVRMLSAVDFSGSVVYVPVHNRSKDDYDSSLNHFNIQEKSKIIVVNGVKGVGKTFFMRQVSAALVKVAAVNDQWNLVVITNTAMRTKFNSEPFISWKSVILRMFMSCVMIQEKKSLSSNSASASQPRSNEKDQVARDQALAGMKILMERIPQELQQYFPLISTISNSLGLRDNDVTSKLVGVNRFLKLQQLLEALLQAFVKFTGAVMVIEMDQLNEIDSYSSKLLYSVLENVQGIIILAAVVSLNSCPAIKHLQVSNSSALNTIELYGINKEATKELVGGVFQAYNLPFLPEVVVNKVFQISGGNPLYAYEMSKAIGQRSQQLLNSFSSSDSSPEVMSTADVQMYERQLSEMLEQVNVGRIEEVICYRFDQLSYPCQMILKMIATATSCGFPTSFEMLAYVIEASNRFGMQRLFENCVTELDIMNRLHEILEEVLLEGEFLRFSLSSSHGNSIVPDGQASGPERPDMEKDATNVSFDASILPGFFLDFQIEMEQKTIYGLMLDEQKAMIHEKVARYLELQAKRKQERVSAIAGIKSSSTATELYAIALHFSNAKEWSSAMKYFFEAGMLCESMGILLECRKFCILAYAMYNKLRIVAGVENSNNHTLLPASFQLQIHELMEETLTTSQQQQEVSQKGEEEATDVIGAEEGAESAVANKAQKLTKRDLYRIFQGNNELLEIGLNVLLRLAQICHALDNDPKVVSKLYEEALELMSIVRHSSTTINNPMVSSDSPTEKKKAGSIIFAENFIAATEEDITTVSSSGSVSKASTRITSLIDSAMDDFGLRNLSICFPILAGIITLYRTKRLPDDDEMTKETSACELFLWIAQSSDQYLVHLINGYGFMRHIQQDLGNIEVGIQLVDNAKEIYNYQQHNMEIIQNYQLDRMPRIFAVNMQILLLRGETERVDEYKEYLDSLFYRVNHLHTLAMMTYPLAVAYVVMGKPAEAYAYFQHYQMVERRDATIFSHFKDINPIFFYFFIYQYYHHLTQHHAGDSEEIIQSLKEQIDELRTTFLDRLLAKQFLKFPMAARNFILIACDFFGISLEYVCGYLLYQMAMDILQELEVKYELNKEDIEQHGHESLCKCQYYLSVALEYIDYYLECIKQDPSFIFAYYITMKCRANALVGLLRLSSYDYHGKISQAVDTMMNQAHHIAVVPRSPKVTGSKQALSSNSTDASAANNSVSIFNAQLHYTSCTLDTLHELEDVSRTHHYYWILWKLGDWYQQNCHILGLLEGQAPLETKKSIRSRRSNTNKKPPSSPRSQDKKVIPSSQALYRNGTLLQQEAMRKMQRSNNHRK